MKAKELRDLSKDQLNEKLKELNLELFNSKFSAKMGSLDNPSVIPAARRNIARIKTILNQLDEA